MIAGLRPGLLYGLLAFLAGAVLGVIRDLALAPSIGSVAAAILEAGVMAVLLCEIALGAWFESSGLAAQRPPRGGVEEAIGLALLGWLAAQPFRVQREG